MELQCSFAYLQQPSTWMNKSSLTIPPEFFVLHCYTLYVTLRACLLRRAGLGVHSVIYWNRCAFLLFTSWSYKWSFRMSGFSTIHSFLSPLMPAACPTHLVLRRNYVGDEHRPYCFSVLSFIQCPVASSVMFNCLAGCNFIVSKCSCDWMYHALRCQQTHK
jgi:hypothetical protein